MRSLSYLWLDVFADRPLAGNALCVFPDGSSLTEGEMQAIARETNLSETTFVLPPTEPGATYRTRIFTPGGELAFAGHPTLGTAAALALAHKVQGASLVQETKSGLTPITLHYENDRLDRVVMEAPQPHLVEHPDPLRVAHTLGVMIEHITPRGLKPAVIESGVRHMVIPIDDPALLARLQADAAALTALSRELGVVGAYPFALLGSEGTAHARARLFAPLYGIPEDAATGSAAAPLGAYLHWNDLMPAGQQSFWYEQGIEMNRPSRLWVQVAERESGLQVLVGGQITLVGRGEFFL